MSVHIKDGATWKAATQPYIKVGATWKPALEVWIKVGATWKKAWPDGTSGGGGSSATFTPSPGSYRYDAPEGFDATFTVGASSSVTWNWSSTGSGTISSTRASGTAGTSIRFTLSAAFLARSRVITLTVGSSTWTITLTTQPITDPGSG